MHRKTSGSLRRGGVDAGVHRPAQFLWALHSRIAPSPPPPGEAKKGIRQVIGECDRVAAIIKYYFEGPSDHNTVSRNHGPKQWVDLEPDLR